MDIFKTIYDVVKDIFTCVAEPVSAARSLPQKFKDLDNQLSTLCDMRTDIKGKTEGENPEKAPTRECSGWIQSVDDIENEANNIRNQLDKRCLKGCFPDVIARASLCEEVKNKISRVQQIHENWKPEADFLIDSPQAKAKVLREKFSWLNNHLTTLCRRRGDIKAEIDRVNLKKAPTGECQGWIADVDDIEKQVNEISEQHLIEEIYSPDVTVLARICENVGTVIRLCEHVEKMLKRVEELQVTSKFEGGYLTDLPLPKVEKMPLSFLSAEKSTNSTLQEILEHLRDGEVQKIGIWGMGGIGKTTLLKLLNNMTGIENMFQVIVWVTVSQTWSIRKIQTEVAKRLSVDIGESDLDSTVATKLHQQLEHKKFLLLLDDVWQEINLDTVGIPTANKNNGSKIVLTTREWDVCKKMRTDKQIDVKALPEKEAWEMFMSIVGLDFTKFPSIREIAQEIVKKCGGLPLALNVVGGVLRGEESVYVWRDLVRKLKSPDASYVKDMKQNVFTALKASYDHLGTDTDTDMKNTFLYCGLFPEDHLIDKSLLINYWRAEGFLWSNDEGHVVLGKLIKASLLEKCEDGNHVRMHDIVRDFALNLTSSRRGEGSIHLVRAGMFKEQTVDIHEWKKATRISFMNSRGLYSLPVKPYCPQLTTLLLQKCSAPFLENFFTGMPRLRVLDLSNSGIVSLPSSIANLEDLRALFLKGCHRLKRLPRKIKALKNLEVLWVTEHNLRDPPPTEMWELTRVKCLIFKGSKAVRSFKTRIPRGKISKLSQLENFVFSGKGFRLDKESTGVVAEELSSLTRLCSLEFEFGSVKNLIKFVENSKPWRDKSIMEFKFFVSNVPWYAQTNPESKCGLYYWYSEEQGDEGRGILSSQVRDVIQRSEFLDIQGIGKVFVKLSDLGVTTISGLKLCSIKYCNAFETFADEEGLQANSFVNLQVLELYDLPNLRNIFGCCEISRMPKNIHLKDNFKILQQLHVRNCPMLKQLFSSRGLLSQLLNLEELIVRGCEGLEEIISENEENVNDEMGTSTSSSSSSSLEYWTPLPKLKTLILDNLKEFVSFFSKGNVPLRWPSLEKLSIWRCPKLKRFPFGASDVDLRRLRELQLSYLLEFVGFGDGNVSYTFSWPSSVKPSIDKCPKLETKFTQKRPTR